MIYAHSMRSLNETLPHPRGYGVYPKVLRRYVRDMKILRLEEAIRKMTALSAQFLGIRDRGLLRKGYKGDIVIFDHNKIEDLSSFEKPATYPKGINYVIVNGSVVIEDGNHTGNLAGDVLFHQF
jgi:N-acyl-D-amino-acid deacylase